MGILHLSHGEVETPVFMPVGTRASVKTLSSEDIVEIGYRLILANTYHLLLRPGPDLIKRANGLRGFTAYPYNFLTDSGGFQVFSLAELRKISDNGVKFRSHIDGSWVELTPEISIDTQLKLGSDIIMVMDECLSYPATFEETKRSMKLTLNWEKRSKTYFLNENGHKNGHFLFGITQGGFDRKLRIEATRQIVDIGFDGYAIGGLSVGEPYELMHELLDVVIPELPEESPRYVMGLGSPLEIAKSVYQGVDMFDCVLPTRLGRHGVLFTSQGKIKIKHSKYREDFNSIDPNCSCFVCKNYSRAYMRHLFHVGEFLGMRLASYHNLYYLYQLMKRIRTAIINDNLGELIRELECYY